jgi:hypothetical protein
MRMHPAFANEILPAITEMRKHIQTIDGQHKLLLHVQQAKEFDFPKLLIQAGAEKLGFARVLIGNTSTTVGDESVLEGSVESSLQT